MGSSLSGNDTVSLLRQSPSIVVIGEILKFHSLKHLKLCLNQTAVKL